MRVTTLGLAAVAFTSCTAAALSGNAHHHRNPSRHSRHFGAKFQPETRELAAEELAKGKIQPPPGAKVFTTSVTPSYSNSSAVDEIDEDDDISLIENRSSIGKRSYSGMRATYYAIGLGACGETDVEPSYIVALNSDQYGTGYPGPECFKSITITGGSKNGQATATIKDECPTCPYGGLDMSEALFENFATLDEGVATITWWYNDATSTTSAAAATSTSTTSSTPTYTSTSVYTPPATTSTTPAYTPTSTSTTSTSVYTPPAATSTTLTSTFTPTSTSVAPTSTSTSVAPPSSSSISSSSIASSSAAKTSSSSSGSSGIVASSLALAKSSTTVSMSTGTATSSSTAAAATSSTSVTDTNLGMLSEYILQIGNLVVEGAELGK